MAEIVAVGTTEYPSSQSFSVDVGTIDVKIDKFKELSEISNAHFEQWLGMVWTNNDAGVTVPIPRFTQAGAEPPARGFLAFGEPRRSETNMNGLRVSCRMVVFRAEDVGLHFQRDLIPMLRDLRALGPPQAAQAPAAARELEGVLIRRFIESALRFYIVEGEEESASAAQKREHIRQKIYSLAGERLGRVCAGCALVSDALRQCACRAGVYYCTRACQVAHWPEHRRDCDRGAIALGDGIAFGEGAAGGV